MIDDISTTEKKNVRLMSRILLLTLILFSTVQPPSLHGKTIGCGGVVDTAFQLASGVPLIGGTISGLRPALQQQLSASIFQGCPVTRRAVTVEWTVQDGP